MDERIQERNIVLSIVFTIITCGLYGIYWFICLTNDANEASGEQGTSGGMAFLFTVITCGIYSLFWAYKMGEKLDIAKEKRGFGSGRSDAGVLYLILCIFGLSIVAWALMQNELNRLRMMG